MIKKILLGSTVALWLGLAGFGFTQIYHYMNKPGEPGTPPLTYPKTTQLNNTGLPKLLFFAHPKCPCTDAGIKELSKIMAKLEGKVETHIIFYHPPKMSKQWVKSTLWQKATKLKGANVLIDSNGELVKQFQPKTSGQVYLYDNNKQQSLIYSGGINSSRGHEGDNTGSNSVTNWVLHKKRVSNVFAVFGCSLFHGGLPHKEQDT